MARLDGKVALITGAGTGIGRATARAMAPEGEKLVVAEINAEAGEQTAQIAAQAGGDCIAVATDVTHEETVSGWRSTLPYGITGDCRSCTIAPEDRPRWTARWSRC